MNTGRFRLRLEADGTCRFWELAHAVRPPGHDDVLEGGEADLVTREVQSSHTDETPGAKVGRRVTSRHGVVIELIALDRLVVLPFVDHAGPVSAARGHKYPVDRETHAEMGEQVTRTCLFEKLAASTSAGRGRAELAGPNTPLTSAAARTAAPSTRRVTPR